MTTQMNHVKLTSMVFEEGMVLVTFTLLHEYVFNIGENDETLISVEVEDKGDVAAALHAAVLKLRTALKDTYHNMHVQM